MLNPSFDIPQFTGMTNAIGVLNFIRNIQADMSRSKILPIKDFIRNVWTIL